MSNRINLQLGEVAVVDWGDTNTTKASYKSSGYKAFSATGPDGFMDHFDFDREAIILSAIGANCGQTWFAEGKWSSIKNTIHIWGKDGKADTKFLYYLTRNPRIWPQRGSAQPFISKGDAERMEISLPSDVHEQRKIASVVSAFDSKIENNNRIIKILEEMAQAIFKEWFVKFRFAGHEKSEFVDSELGKIPKGWELGHVKDACLSVLDGDWIETKDQGGSDFRLLQVSNIGVGDFHETGNFRYITKQTFERLRCTEIEPGDILVARMPKPTGRAWLVTPMPWRMVTAVDIAIIKVDPEKYEPHLLTNFLNSRANLSYVEKLTIGSTRSRLARRDLAAIPLLIPPKSLQEKWRGFAGGSYATIVKLREQNIALAMTRDLLLPKLMSGKVRV